LTIAYATLRGLYYFCETGALLRGSANPSQAVESFWKGAVTLIKVRDAVIASASPPILFPAAPLREDHEDGRTRHFVDGGVRELLPTQYENPPDYDIVLRRFNEIHSIAASVDRSLPFRPLLGTIAEGDLNAYVRKPTAEYILAINSGAIKISWGLAKILALSLPTLESNSTREPFDTDWPEVLKHLQSSPEPSQRFRELLGAIVTRKHPYFAPKYLIDSDNKKALGFVAAINASLELFLVGHEYAHLADGHFDGKIRRIPEDKFPRAPK
jgi:hypothetical protein